MALAPGTVIGPYAITAAIGRGGMGIVYLAHDPRLDRAVAVKVLPPDLTRDATATARFRQEAKAASALDHANICTIYEINTTTDSELYLVMAYYEGETLKQRIAGGALPVDVAVDIGAQVADGLVTAHAAGIIHRDIKPANLLVTKAGVAKILDFGLAKLTVSEGVTETGTAVGTVAYMSPEQAQGEQVDHRTDIWSLGVVLYELLAGQAPFQGELIDALARLDGLRVVARTSAFQFKGQSADVRRIGEQLNVQTVMEGSVRKAGTRLRINAQLISTSDGYHLWSERYDRDLDDVFAVQDDIARTVVDRLKVQLLGGISEPLVSRPSADLEAYDLYLRGCHQLRPQTHDGALRALDLFEQASRRDPTYAQPYTGIAEVYAWLATVGWAAPRETMPKARDAARQALARDGALADAHVSLGGVLFHYDWDWSGAEREFRDALDLSPGLAEARAAFGQMLVAIGHAEAGLAAGRRAVELDPLSLATNLQLALSLLLSRQFEASIAQARRTLTLDAAFFPAVWVQAVATAALGDHDAAVGALELVRGAAGGDPIFESVLGWVYGRAGRRDEAGALLAALEQRRQEHHLAAVAIAWVYAGLDDADQMMSWLTRALDERDGLCVYLATTVLCDPFRADPRFEALIGRMRFPQPVAAPR